MRRSIDDARDAHPDGDDGQPPSSWMVALADDCDGCADVRVTLTLEELGGAGTGLVAHLDPDGARRVRAALGDALAEIGEDRGR